MPLQKDARPLGVKTDDVLYDLLTPPNDYLSEDTEKENVVYFSFTSFVESTFLEKYNFG